MTITKERGYFMERKKARVGLFVVGFVLGIKLFFFEMLFYHLFGSRPPKDLAKDHFAFLMCSFLGDE